MSDVAVWGDFEVHFSQLVGRGGMGSVYRARQLSLDRWVAVKVLDTSSAPDPDLAQGFLEKFHIEARALARLKDPRIVTILQAGEHEGRCWFAMELVEGRTVEEALSEEGAFAEHEARRVGIEVARALDAAWRQGITHHDVKPANIFLCLDGSVKLADFGLARSVEFAPTRITDVRAIACSPAYASPELAEGKATDHRSDIYSLGCVLYESVTERPPFQGDAPMEVLFKHSSMEPDPPRLLNPKVSPHLERIILKCLAKRPEDRYADYEELLRDLEESPKASSPTGWFWPAAAVAGAALFGIVLAAVLLHTEDPPVAAEPVKSAGDVRLVREKPAPLEQPAAPVYFEPPPPEPEPEPEPLPAHEPTLLERLRAYAPTEEEMDELDAYYERGEPTTTHLATLVALEESRDREELTLEEALRRVEDEPELALLLGGIVRRECDAIVAAMEHGELLPEPEIPGWVAPYARSAIARMRRERAAMEAPEAAVLKRYAGTWAYKRLVRRALEEFRAELRRVPLEGWAFTRVPRPKEDSSWDEKQSLLQDPTSSSTIEREGLQRGWRIEFEFQPARDAEDPALFAIPGTVSRDLHYLLFRYRPGELAVVRKEGGKVTPRKPCAETEKEGRRLLAFVPRGELVLVYLDGKLAHVEEMALDRSMRIGVQQGRALIHKVEARP